jgi:prolyl 4-hydroxylase
VSTHNASANNASANNAFEQAITPALRAWLTEQQAAGFGADQLLKSLIDAGWGDALARHVLAMPTQLAPDNLPSPLSVPWPAHAGERLALDAGDRQVNAITVLQDPPLLVLEGLLSHAECQALIAAAAPRMSRSLTVDMKTGGEETNDGRTSEGMFFERGENALVRCIEARIGQLLDWPVHNGEGLQVLHYGPGAEYQPHYDFFDPAEPGTASILQRGGQRVATLVIYLNEPEAGGATIFPDAALTVVPKCGNAVFFNYSQPSPVSRTLHGGAPVLSGDKWIATKWLREREFI